MKCFLTRLQRTRACRKEEDKVIWTKSKNGKFSVQILYLALGPRSPTFPTGVIWNPRCCQRWTFLLRRLLRKMFWENVLTLDHLKRRRRSLTNKCFLCHLDEERIHWSHLYPPCQDKDFMAFVVFPVWHVLGASLFI